MRAIRNPRHLNVHAVLSVNRPALPNHQVSRLNRGLHARRDIPGDNTRHVAVLQRQVVHVLDARDRNRGIDVPLKSIEVAELLVHVAVAPALVARPLVAHDLPVERADRPLIAVRVKSDNRVGYVCLVESGDFDAADSAAGVDSIEVVLAVPRVVLDVARAARDVKVRIDFDVPEVEQHGRVRMLDVDALFLLELQQLLLDQRCLGDVCPVRARWLVDDSEEKQPGEHLNLK